MQCEADVPRKVVACPIMRSRGWWSVRETSNPAGRLAQILATAVGSERDVTVAQAWRRVLSLDEKNHVQLVHRLLEVIGLPDQIRGPRPLRARTWSNSPDSGCAELDLVPQPSKQHLPRPPRPRHGRRA